MDWTNRLRDELEVEIYIPATCAVLDHARLGVMTRVDKVMDSFIWTHGRRLDQHSWRRMKRG